MSWTRFMDMSSGGGRKERHSYIYIEAPEDESKVIFYKRFGHNPERVSCTCCGDDYIIDESESFEQASGYDRGCAHVDGAWVEEPATDGWYHQKYRTVDEYLTDPDVLVIREADIKPEERVGDVPRQGYVWAA